MGYFEDDTITAVKKLLPESAEGDLADFCSWPDEIKNLSQWKWTSVLHYVNTPKDRCNYQYCRDCHDTHKHKGWCVTGAIFNYTNQLMSASKNSQSIVHYNLTEALLFLSHYMGDVHQPLHTGFLGDLGGNTIIVNWYHHETNLHHVWDNMIIESALETYYNSSLPRMIEALQAKLKNGWSNDVPSWESCQFHQKACPNQYASESIDLACKYAYRNATPETTLGDDYFLSRLPVVEKRLAQGNVKKVKTLRVNFDIFAGAEMEDVMEEIQTQKKEEQKHREEEEEEEEEEGPPPGWESAVLPPPIATVNAAVNPNPTTADVPEMAQMVCGSCRRLLSYLRGSKHVKCSCCQTVNFVLEANQVGQVNCSNCKLLLLYPYGAPSVRCSSCNSVTDIRESNKRPPWSEQQGPLKSLSSVR